MSLGGYGIVCFLPLWRSLVSVAWCKSFKIQQEERGSDSWCGNTESARGCKVVTGKSFCTKNIFRHYFYLLVGWNVKCTWLAAPAERTSRKNRKADNRHQEAKGLKFNNLTAWHKRRRVKIRDRAWCDVTHTNHTLLCVSQQYRKKKNDQPFG